MAFQHQLWFVVLFMTLLKLFDTTLSNNESSDVTNTNFALIKTVPYTPSGQYFYSKHLRTATPLLLQGAAKNWVALSNWNNYSYLQEKFGKEVVNAKTVQSDTDKETEPPEEVTLTEFLKSYKDKQLVFEKILNNESPFLSDIRLPMMLQCQELVEGITNLKLNFGRPKEFPALRRVEYDTMLTAITGTLRVTFFSKRHDSNSKIEPTKAEKLFLPVTLNAGDILFIPKYSFILKEDSFIKPAMSLQIGLDIFHFDSSKYSTGNELVEEYFKYLANQPDHIACNLGRKNFNENLAEDFDSPQNTPHLRIPKKNSHPDDVTLSSGYTMPVLGLGTGSLGNDTYKAVRNALRIGYRLFDTAYAYENSEAQIGKAIRDSGIPRKDVFIVTKLHPRFFGYMETLRAIDESLKRLNMDYIDAFLIHNFECDDKKNLTCEKGEPRGKWQESWEAMEDAYSLGKLRSLGVCNVTPMLLREIIAKSVLPVSIVQNWFDPLHQENDVRKVCKKHGIRFMSYSIFGYKWFEHGLQVNPILVSTTLRAISAHYDFVVYHPILRWAIHKNVTVIPRSANPIHQAQNFRSLDIELFPQDIPKIDVLGDFVESLMDEREDLKYEDSLKKYRMHGLLDQYKVGSD